MLTGRLGISPVMIGRAAPLTQLLGLLDASSVGPGGTPTVALVAGEAGIGKTRLLRELVAAAGPSVVVLAGQADPGSLGRPFELVRAVLGADVPGADDPVRAAVDAVGAQLAGRMGLLIFEDLHWADAESVAVIDRIAQQPWPHVLLVGTYRPEDLTRRMPGGDLLLRLERRHAIEQVRLEPLNRNEVGSLLSAIYGRTPASSVIEALYQRTGGNPFVIEELVGCCRDVAAEDLLTARLPWSLEEVVRQQLEGLTPEDRRVVETAAICGATTSFDVLGDVLGMDEAALLRVLRGLVERGLLVEAGDDEFGFRHALVRDAVSNQLLGRERRQLHLQALAALRARPGADHAALARHAAGAQRWDELVEIAREGSAAYLAQGSTFQALRLADDALAEQPDDVTLLGVATQAAWLVGLLEEALGYAERWRAAALGSPDAEAEAEALRFLMRVSHELDRTDDRDAIVERLVVLTQELPAGRTRARAMGSIAQAHLLADRPADAVVWADRAQREAEACGAHDVAVQARIERWSAEGIAGHPQADPELRRAVEDAEAIGDWVLATRGLNNLLEGVPPHTTAGREIVSRYLHAAERAGFDQMSVAVGHVRRFQIAFGEAEIQDAHLALERAHEWWLARSKAHGWITSCQLELAYEEGRLDDARALLEGSPSGRDHATELDADDLWWRHRMEVQLAVMGNDHEAARRWFAELCRLRLPEHRTYLPRDVFEVVGCALAAGVPPQDVRSGLLAQVHESVDSPDRWQAADGLVALAENDYETAATLLLAAAEVEDSSLTRFHQGWLRVRAAEALLAAGNRSAARRAVEVALDDLSHWPGWRRDRARALARRLEGPVAVSDGSDLTAREREVASLLAEGLTNTQLAERLYISPRTAAVHVSNILMKLEMSSRAEVAAWAVRNGLVAEKAG